MSCPCCGRQPHISQLTVQQAQTLLHITAKRKPRAIKPIGRRSKFPRRLWIAAYAQAVQPKLDKRASAILQDAYDHGILQRYQDYLRLHGRLKAAAPPSDDEWLTRFLSPFADEHPLELAAPITKLGGQVFQAGSIFAYSKLGIDATWKLDSPAVHDALEQRVNKISAVDDTQFQQIRDLIHTQTLERGASPVDPDFLRQLQTAAGKASQYEAERIARTETAAMYGKGSFTVYGANGVEQKEWLWSGSGYPRHENLADAVVDLNEPFIAESGEQLMYPGDPDADISETANCGCDYAPLISSVLDPDEVVTE